MRRILIFAAFLLVLAILATSCIGGGVVSSAKQTATSAAGEFNAQLTAVATEKR